MEFLAGVIGILLVYLGLLILFINPKDRDMTRYTDSIKDKFEERFMK